MSIDGEFSLRAAADLHNGLETITPAALEFEAAKYQPYLEDVEISDAQKRELLETLWSIMCSFAELGQSVNICERFFAGFENIPQTGQGEVESPLRSTTGDASEGQRKDI